MDGANTAVYQPVSALVKSPSSHLLHPAGVMPIDLPSCKTSRAGKRARIATVSPSTISRPNPSRITKKNPKSNSFGRKPSLAKSVHKPGHSYVANDAVVVTPTATTESTATSLDTYSSAAAADELVVLGYECDRPGQSPIISLDFQPGFDLPNTSPETTNHYVLYTNVTQPQDADLSTWSGSGTASLSSSSLNPPKFHSPAPYLPVHETSPHDHFPRGHSADYSGSTAHTYGEFSFFPYLDPYSNLVNSSPMAVQELIPLGDARCQHELGHSQPSASVSTTECSAVPDDWVVVGSEKSSEDVSPSHSAELSDPSSDTTPSTDREPCVDSPEATSTPAIDESQTPSQPERRCRSRLEGSSREQAANTRKIKKIKCKPDPENPKTLRCLNCRLLNQESKKVVHRIPCLRYKLTEIVLFREGGLGLTQRWNGVKMKDLGPRDWDGGRERPLKITIGKFKCSFELVVRKFKPLPTDITWRNWVDRSKTLKRIEIEPYALANITKTAKEYKSYVYVNAQPALRQYVKNPKVDELVRKTYNAALDYAIKLDEYPQEFGEVNPQNFLTRYFRLWFAIRNTTGSAFIDGKVGEETLEMTPETDPECPYNKTVSVPRMITAQFDSLAYETILAPQRKLVLEGLWKMMGSKDQQYFFTIYLTVFMLLHEVSIISADRLRHARDNKSPHRYTLAPFVEGLQEGANIILGHWHYYKRDIDPLLMNRETGETKETKQRAEKAVWGRLGSEETDLLAETYKVYKARKNDPRETMTWEHDLFFVSQMFDEKWKPEETFMW
ncbi:hypothetical protein F4779DRAFT_631537 [Xylariaceae sp. FL0662B]|nr:hypothetical protein F4779DRAFT_631537 [Xylariaceae sp. FL0662B]